MAEASSAPKASAVVDTSRPRRGAGRAKGRKGRDGRVLIAAGFGAVDVHVV
eukprot:CAMPEP_0175779938 /NCGR_PEP_ID=MMETSP0097-20121207/76479_1 /TAXON_ID=311494 /ORGANISM="Alexandrium monilatum, Strain CCMP3105" /LENGTH=50 /DNA_ID=CAMNT_0017090651 /DNA_START=48 /DNA_END=198 /DNA_ORIENTATION=-